ncbi:nitrate reductase (quinol-dependent), transmembrane subunit [Neorhodopirellula lusitana]|uniref:Nitrate reductase (Quinol-dependent), transmembrane subunit n=1 Tax=Neorhodopirellula lusitana TaxID=445327 RepID=A0ABY1QHP4_9BACT|nr:nitrate reductase (quinol-dependent), transmembrane subunit [Neorhodopirellula lusitana]
MSTASTFDKPATTTADKPLSMTPSSDGSFDLVGMLLKEQQTLSAVEQFSKSHDNLLVEDRQTESDPDQAVYYRRLMPATPPAADQQYAFEVDLDACSGCKACVVACHTLNGLEETESWRKVGTLTIGELDSESEVSTKPATDSASGGVGSLPIAIAPVAAPSVAGVQHVTTACHHCEDPGCLNGCPVKAYDKDPETGIVRHLDDQCIGCKYCTMMCPYEVPKYSKRLGIVRKCDMCHQRLKVGEAPACVQSCPNEAIAIRTVSTGEEFAISDRLVAGAPVSSITKPTTKFITRRAEALAEAIPQDAAIDSVAESHWPLAIMLVATQISVAMIVVERLWATGGWLMGNPVSIEATRLNATASLLIAIVGLNLASLHLGQPLRAWRVFLGLRTSWLSREAVVLGKYAGALAVAVALMWLPVVAPYAPEFLTSRIPDWVSIPSWANNALLAAAILFGVAGLYCSAMIYIATKRKLWRYSRTLPRFFGSGVVVGAALTSFAFWLAGGSTTVVSATVLFAAISAAWKLSWEGRFHLHQTLALESSDDLDRRSHRLMTGQLDRFRKLRLWTGWVGVAACVLAMGAIASESMLFTTFSMSVACICLLGGEVIERLLYFMSVVYDRMPGTLR